MKSNVKSYKDFQLLERVSKLDSFKGFPEGFFDIWVRSEEDAYNIFDDKVYTFYGYGDLKLPKFIMVSLGTTNAGSEGLKHFNKYNTKGCAVLKANHIVYDYAIRRKHKGKYLAWCQNKPWPYYRDNNLDTKIDESGEEYYDIIGANCHAAGDNSVFINKWSVACLVRNNKEEFNKWMSITKKQKFLTVCILDEF